MTFYLSCSFLGTVIGRLGFVLSIIKFFLHGVDLAIEFTFGLLQVVDLGCELSGTVNCLGLLLVSGTSGTVSLENIDLLYLISCFYNNKCFQYDFLLRKTDSEYYIT